MIMTSEELFVTKCIIKERQSRLLFELQKPNKRNYAIDRFSHNAKQLIKSDRIIKYISLSEVKHFLINNSVWAIYPYDNGGKFLSREDAWTMIENQEGPIILISLPNYAILKFEDNDIVVLSLYN